MSQYQADIAAAGELIQAQGTNWNVDPENVARMKAQNRFRTGLDIANYTAKIMRDDMAAYDADTSNYTMSLGCWHGFIAQQKMISVKKYLTSTKGTYLYLSGWMIAALRSEFGPLPDQSMHEKTSVPALIEELYTFLRQADARELGLLFRDLDAWIRSRLRSTQLKKWKKPRKFQRIMIKAGFDPTEAHRVWIKMNRWQSVMRRPVRFVMNLNWFRERGLVFLHDFTLAFSRT